MATLMELINFFDHESKEYEEFLQNLIYSNGDVPFDIEEVTLHFNKWHCISKKSFVLL